MLNSPIFNISENEYLAMQVIQVLFFILTLTKSKKPLYKHLPPHLFVGERREDTFKYPWL
jgi:hypothetical protein